MSIDQQIDQFFAPIAKVIFDVVLYSVPIMGADVKLLLIWFIAAALFFSFYLGFVNFRYFGHGVKVALGRYDDPNDDGEISSFQAMMASLSGTVGLGNIAGVAVAVSLGGPGATFWMIVMGLLGMSTKFAEVTLGVKYRRHASPEHPEALSGGPMYYLQEGLATRGWPKAGRILGIFFALSCILGSFGGASLFQSNQLFQQAVNVTGGEEGFLSGNGWIFGLGLAFLTGLVIIGGIKSIARVAATIVPVMAILYILCAITIIGMNVEMLPAGIAAIFTGAFSMEAGIGGLIGGIMVGVQRASFSNESGLGTAAIVYSAARAKHPIMQGMASMLGPFVDTVLVCTMTALAIIISGVLDGSDGLQGVELTSSAFATVHPYFPYFLTFAVFLFAYSTLITFAYYAEKCAAYLFGERDSVALAIKLVYLALVVVGASTSLSSIIDMTDGLFLLMAVPNILGMYIFAPEIKALLKDYISLHKPSK
ncbi:MAG: alanine:cation symporter family protein [Micavibrio sp.]|nr:alanine:cation symporter family protein [Micavibrio sp.]